MAYSVVVLLLLLLLFVMFVGLCLEKIDSEELFLLTLSHSTTSLDVLLKRFIITRLTKIVYFLKPLQVTWVDMGRGGQGGEG